MADGGSGLDNGGGASGAVSGFLSWMHWVEVEAPDLVEGLGRLKGAVMAVGAAEDVHSWGWTE